MEMMELLESALHSFVNLAMLLFEYIGVGVITFAGIQGIVNYIRRKPETRLVLAQGLAMGLEFKLGSEILRTVVVRSLSEIAIVGSIIALRAVLTILIHWEIKNEKNEEGEIYQAARKKTTKAHKDSAADPSGSFPDPVLDADLIDSLIPSDATTNTPDSAKASNSAKSSGDSAKASGSMKSSSASTKASGSTKSSSDSAKASGSAKTSESSKASHSSSPYAPLRPVEELDDSFFALPKSSDKDN